MSDHTQRFNSRAQVYVAGRPSYPVALIQWLRDHFAVEAKVADIGAGTGILSVQLADAGFSVIAVEPSEPMRAEIPTGITSLNGTAEVIPLPDASVDLVTVAQAFHWFDQPAAMREFARILGPGGKVTLIWNQRDDTTEIGAAYKSLVERHRFERIPHVGARATSNGLLNDEVALKFDNPQLLTLSGLLSRVHSTSYMSQSPELDADFAELFHQFSVNGVLTLPQSTEMYVGFPRV
jgi:SAM-dependent methyltransferase